MTTTFSRDTTCQGCGRAYVVSGASELRPGSETEVLAQFRCACGQWMGAFVPGSVDHAKLVITLKDDGRSPGKSGGSSQA